ncbi:SPOR domain-containing protein [Chlorobaculum thiosulfatiphilum]|nr:SPOR domain-containing protein [Chlorobaculum thiosulfatiphilum]
MAADTASDILARLLGIDSDEAQRRLDRFAGGMTAELLDRKLLAIDGLGGFSVVHEQAVRQATSAGIRYQPPKNRVAFEARKERAGDAERIATGRLGMEASEVKRFAKALAETFEAVKKGPGRLELRGFGSFTLVSGALRFQPEASLEALLNIGYGDLKEIVIPEKPPDKQTPPVPERPGGLKKVALFVAAVSILACGWFLYRQFAPGGFDLPSAGGSAESVIAASVATVASSVPPSSIAPGIVPSSPDSLQLRKGRYTVIVATFNTRKVVRQEMARLSEMGYRVWFWPVKSGSGRSYRIVTGDFGTRRSALDSMKSMPKGLPQHSYIQQAQKNVVLYGEQGL